MPFGMPARACVRRAIRQRSVSGTGRRLKGRRPDPQPEQPASVARLTPDVAGHTQPAGAARTAAFPAVHEFAAPAMGERVDEEQATAVLIARGRRARRGLPS
jgi:hypothetical protein